MRIWIAAVLGALVLGASFALAQEFLKQRSAEDYVRVVERDGHAYLHFPAQIRATGSREWSGVTISIEVGAFERLIDEALTEEH
jgi:hypothetical protein